MTTTLEKLSKQITPVAIVDGNGNVQTQDGSSGLVVVSQNVPTPTAGARLSGQITVTTSGTAVRGPDVPLTNGVWIKALRANTGNMYVGNDGYSDVTTNNGFELDAGEAILAQVSNLNELWFDASVSAEKVCWLKA